jgi:hypothetical protein
MATELTLQRADGKPFGAFEEAKSLIRRAFPTVEFFWTTSGAEKIRMATEKGIKIPPMILEGLDALPSLLEGVAEGDDFQVSFGLGYEEPVMRIYATPRGLDPELQRGLEMLEAEADAEFKVSDGDD